MKRIHPNSRRAAFAGGALVALALAAPVLGQESQPEDGLPTSISDVYAASGCYGIEPIRNTVYDFSRAFKGGDTPTDAVYAWLSENKVFDADPATVDAAVRDAWVEGTSLHVFLPGVTLGVSQLWDGTFGVGQAIWCKDP